MLRLVAGLVRKSVDKLQDALEDGTRQRITFLGLIFICFIVVVGAAAFVSGNNLLFLLFAALLATFLISGFVSRLGLAGLELDIVMPPHVTARRTVTGRVKVRNRKWLMPSFSLQLSGAPDTGLTREISITMIPAGETLDQLVQIEFDRRGIYRDNNFFFASRFPFGFTHRRAEVHLKQEILIYPSIEPQLGFEEILHNVNGEIESRQRGLGTDFYRIRPYVSLEHARHVDWRATAHTGGLQLREFVQEQNRSVAIFLDLSVSTEQLEWFETAVDCCAYLVTQLAAKGVAVQFVAQGYERRIPLNADAYDILKFLATVEPGSATHPTPLDENSVQIAISARPEVLPQFGIENMAQVLSLAELEPAGANERPGDEDPASGENIDHRDGASGSGGPGVRLDTQ